MSNAAQPSDSFSGRPGGSPARRSTQAGVRLALYLVMAAAVASIAYAALRVRQDQDAMRKGQDRLVAMRGLVETAPKQLAPGYTDKDGGLLADTPSDPAKLIDPEVIVVAHYEGDEDDAPLVNWQGFKDHLAAATGKEVSLAEYYNSTDDIAAVQAGKIHVVAMHSADVPYAVNNTGYVPIAVLGTEAKANGNHLAIVVRPDSLIKSLADVRSHKLTCTRPDSITGYRAAIVVLAQDAGLRPDVDYRVHFSHGQKRSIVGLIEGNFEVAALSDDKLQSLIAEGEIKPSDYRVIYESQIIPRLSIGYVYNLQPELAAKIAAAITGFENQPATTEQPADAEPATGACASCQSTTGATSSSCARWTPPLTPASAKSPASRTRRSRQTSCRTVRLMPCSP